MDPANLKVFDACLVVVIPAAVIPWRYVVTHYVTKPVADRTQVPERTVPLTNGHVSK